MKKSDTISIAEFKSMQKGSNRKEHNKDREYQVCKAVSDYLKLKYPSVIYHFDYAGLNLTRTQAGKMKAIQGDKGFPDLAIYLPKKFIEKGEFKTFAGLFIELKTEETEIYKTDAYRCDTPTTSHIADQIEMLRLLRYAGYKAEFACGTDEAMALIDKYMKL